MSSLIMSNLFKLKSPSSRGRVVSRVGTDTYVVRDILGRLIRVNSDLEWKIGVDWVSFSDGRITGRAEKGSVPQTFSV